MTPDGRPTLSMRKGDRTFSSQPNTHAMLKLLALLYGILYYGSEMNLINGDKEQTDSCRPIYDARGENLIRYRDLSFRKNEKLTHVFGLDPTQCVER